MQYLYQSPRRSSLQAGAPCKRQMVAVEQALKGGHHCKQSGMSDGSKRAWCRPLGTTVRRLGGLEDGGGGRRPKERPRRSWGQALHCLESCWHKERGLYVQEGAL